jgi:hypothetical protein
MCFVFIWEQTASCSTYSISWLVFITEMKCLLRGTDWVFKLSSQRFVFKWLILPLFVWMFCSNLITPYWSCIFVLLNAHMTYSQWMLLLTLWTRIFIYLSGKYLIFKALIWFMVGKLKVLASVWFIIQGASLNRAILQHCFFLVRQHWDECRYRHFAANINPFQSNFPANRILPSSYLFWAGKRAVDYL